MQRVYKYFQFYYNFMIHIENFQILGIIQDGIAYTESSYFLWLIKLILYYIKKKIIYQYFDFDKPQARKYNLN